MVAHPTRQRPRGGRDLRRTPSGARVTILLWTLRLVAASDFDDSGARHAPWSLLRGVERTLQGTAGVVKGVGDALAVGTGGVIRTIGGVAQDVGGGVEGLGDAVAGESKAEDGQREVSDGLRSVASRPIRLVGRALRAVGDTTNFLGDTTERLASEAVGIFPDAVRVVESGVRNLRQTLPGDDDDHESASTDDNGTPATAFGEGATMTGLKLRRLEEGLSAPHTSAVGSSTPSTAELNDAYEHKSSTGSEPQRAWRSQLLRRVDRWRVSSEVRPSSRLRSHALVALVTVAIGARSTPSMLGLSMLVLLALLYLGSLAALVEAEQRDEIRREAVAAERAKLYLDPRLPLLPEAASWLNTLIASGWGTTLLPYLITRYAISLHLSLPSPSLTFAACSHTSSPAYGRASTIRCMSSSCLRASRPSS